MKRDKLSKWESASTLEPSELFFALWPSQSFCSLPPVLPEAAVPLLYLFKQAHRCLTSLGILVFADPRSADGTNNHWNLRGKLTSKFVSPARDAAKFIRRRLESQDLTESENIRVTDVKVKQDDVLITLHRPTILEERMREAWEEARDQVPTAKAPKTKQASKTTKVGRDIDQRKFAIAMLKAKYPSLSARGICQKLDYSTNRDQGPLKSWIDKAEDAIRTPTWTELYDLPSTNNPVRSFINKIPPLKKTTTKKAAVRS